MIEFKNTPVNDEAVDRLVAEMKKFGYEGEDAQRIADAAGSIAIATLRSLDDKIMEAASDDADRTVIQQIVLFQLIGSCQRGLELNAVQHFLKMMGISL